MPTIVVLEGDETGQELLEEALRVLDPEVTGLDVTFDRHDLSLENRRATENKVVLEAAAAIREHGLGLKAATVTPEGVDDVGSPNRILREEIGGRVIVRTGRRIPGVIPHGGVHAPISVVRMAVGDAYGAKEWREGEGADEVAFRTERIERRICRGVAEFAFQLAERTGAKVFGGPEVHRQPGLRGHAQRGDGRRGRAPSGRAVRAAADRRDVRTAHRDGRRSARDSVAEPGRRHPVRPRPAALRIDRRSRVAARRVRRRRSDPGHGRHGRGRARDRARAPGQERRQPAGDDPRRSRRPGLRGRSRSRSRARSARRRWRRSRKASAPPTSPATQGRPSSPTR